MSEMFDSSSEEESILSITSKKEAMKENTIENVVLFKF
jgi:hypothetical protein